jgi:hypothetical protein
MHRAATSHMLASPALQASSAPLRTAARTICMRCERHAACSRHRASLSEPNRLSFWPGAPATRHVIVTGPGTGGPIDDGAVGLAAGDRYGWPAGRMGGDQDDAVGSASPLHVPFSAVRARALPIPAHGAGPSLLWEPSDGNGAGGCDRCRCTCGGVRRGRGSRTKLLIQDDELMLINFPISCRRSTTHHTMLFHDFIIDHTTRQPPHFVRRDSSGPPTPCTFFLFFLICSCFFKKNIRL